MPEPPDAELAREVARLRDAYRRKLPGRLSELDVLLRQAREPGGREPLEAARDLAHTLKGASGSYGLDEISAELQGIEEELGRRLEGAASGGGAGWSRVERAIARIRGRLAQEGGPA